LARPAGWILVSLLLMGALAQACSKQSDQKGPTFPTTTSGHSDTPASTRVSVNINPNTIEPGQRAGITVLVQNAGGFPLKGKTVQLSTTAGRLDSVFGTTDAAGKFVTFLKIEASDVTAGVSAAIITAIVEGAVGTATVAFSGAQDLFLSPGSVSQTVQGVGDDPGTCTLGGFTTQFTVSGGVPPYTFTVAGLKGSRISGGGLYKIDPFTAAGGTKLGDVVTVTDSQGRSKSASVSLECLKSTPPPPPPAVTISPSSVARTFVANAAGICAATFTVQFTASGGTPPYTFSAAGPGTVTSGGFYTFSRSMVTGEKISDTVTVKDSLGSAKDATISVDCVKAP
jgi:hypothetical protein